MILADRDELVQKKIISDLLLSHTIAVSGNTVIAVTSKSKAIIERLGDYCVVEFFDSGDVTKFKVLASNLKTLGDHLRTCRRVQKLVVGFNGELVI